MSFVVGAAQCRFLLLDTAMHVFKTEKPQRFAC
jgi:hypothetical protein